VRDEYSNVSRRKPDVLVIPEGFATRYLGRELRPGEKLSVQERKALSDHDAVRFMRDALADRLPGYTLAREAEGALPGWLSALGFEPVRVHGSTGMRTWILRRADSGASAPNTR